MSLYLLKRYHITQFSMFQIYNSPAETYKVLLIDKEFLAQLCHFDILNSTVEIIQTYYELPINYELSIN